MPIPDYRLLAGPVFAQIPPMNRLLFLLTLFMKKNRQCADHKLNLDDGSNTADVLNGAMRSMSLKAATRQLRSHFLEKFS
jgi:hypothetical protein